MQMNPNYVDKPIDEFLFRLYKVESRYSRKIIRELLLNRKNAEIYSRVLTRSSLSIMISISERTAMAHLPSVFPQALS